MRVYFSHRLEVHLFASTQVGALTEAQEIDAPMSFQLPRSPTQEGALGPVAGLDPHFFPRALAFGLARGLQTPLVRGIRW